MNNAAQVDREVDVQRLCDSNDLNSLLLDLLHVEDHLEAFDDWLPVRLVCVKVVSRDHRIELSIRLVLMVKAGVLIEEDLLCCQEEHGCEVAPIFVDNDHINAILDFETDRVLVWHILLNLLLLITVKLKRCVIVFGPNLADFKSFISGFLAQLLHNVQVIHGNLSLKSCQ